MDRVLHDFILSLRSLGVRISTSETMDAFRALEVVGCEDREIVKSSLSATLAKTAAEQEIFDECFDRFFFLDQFSDGEPGDAEHASCPDIQQAVSPLTEMLISGDQAGLMTSLMQAAEEAESNEIKFFTQKGRYTYRILTYMGIDGLDRDIKAFMQGNTLASMQRAFQLQEARDSLVKSARDFVERQHDLHARSATDDMIERYLKNAKLSDLEKRDFDRMYVIIQKMVKRLNDTHSRRRKSYRRGQLDFRKTLRKNMAHEGILFDIKWKMKKINRPDVIVICDVSRSVASVVRFFLLLLYGLSEAIIKIRTFIFCSNIIEVSSVFDQYPVEQAVAKLQSGAGLDIQLGPTHYGEAFLDFNKNWLNSVTRRTSVIILGDARNNYGDPQTAALKLIQEKSKRVIWLNPENQTLWGTGDSEMKRYLPYCSIVRECNTLSQLERVISSIL